jgi:hypothetical protein
MKTKNFLASVASELGVSIDIKQNPNIPTVGNLIIDNLLTDEVCPFEDIYEEYKTDYCLELPDGTRRPHPPMSAMRVKIDKFIAINKEDPSLYADNKIN